MKSKIKLKKTLITEHSSSDSSSSTLKQRQKKNFSKNVHNKSNKGKIIIYDNKPNPNLMQIKQYDGIN